MTGVGDPLPSTVFDGRLDWVPVAGDPAASWQAWCKRGLDLLLSLLMMPILLPILGALAILVRLDSRGPALFLDQRLGRHGRRFTCYKFRTMHLDSDRILEAHLARSPEAQAEWQRFRKLRGEDPRVTRVGRVYRKLSLDELPQIFNVISGQMSLVGPRPYLVKEEELMGASRSAILQVRPGITGLWQVSGRNEIAFEHRLVLESWYARNWNLRFDLVILLRTIWVVLARKGAF